MLLKALFIGMRFDLRLAVLLSLIHIVLSLLPYVNISNSIWIKQLSKFYNYIVIIILLLALLLLNKDTAPFLQLYGRSYLENNFYTILF